MPLELHTENPMSPAASYQDLVLALIVHILLNIYQRLFDLIVLRIFQAVVVFRLLVPSKIFKFAHCLRNPSIKRA